MQGHQTLQKGRQCQGSHQTLHKGRRCQGNHQILHKGRQCQDNHPFQDYHHKEEYILRIHFATSLAASTVTISLSTSIKTTTEAITKIIIAGIKTVSVILGASTSRNATCLEWTTALSVAIRTGTENVRARCGIVLVIVVAT